VARRLRKFIVRTYSDRLNPIVFDRRVIPVKWFMRGLSAPLLCVGMLGMLGCGTDNDTEADRLAKTIGDPGAPDPKGKPATTEAPPTSQEEFYKRQQKQQEDTFKKGGYPGKK